MADESVEMAEVSSSAVVETDEKTEEKRNDDEESDGKKAEENLEPDPSKSSEATGDPVHPSPPEETPAAPQTDDSLLHLQEPMDTSAAAVEEPSPDAQVKEEKKGAADDAAVDGEENAETTTKAEAPAPMEEASLAADRTGNEEEETGAPGESGASRIKIVIQTQDETKVVSVGPDATVAELKLAASSNLKLSVNRICLIFSGKMLLDEETLETHNISDGSIVYMMTKPRQQTSEPDSQQPFAFAPEQFSTIGTMPVSFIQLQHQLQKQMASNPDMVRQLIDNPLVQQLMVNPSVMKEMMMSVPQSKDLLERHPEISDLLNNQEVMKQTLEMARNPATLEAALAQIEQANAESSIGFTAQSDFAFPGFSLGANASVPDSTALLQQLTANPQLVQRMLEAPYMPTIMEGLAKNPLWAQQMIAQNPLFAKNPHLQQQMAVMMPYYIQQMQNPEMLALMTNPKALQAMLRIQQGMNVLQSEAPNLAGSIGLPYLSVPPSPASFGAMHYHPGAGDAGREAFSGGILGAQYDPFSIMMSQIVQQMANKQMNLPPEQRYVEQLDRLHSMGFTDRESNLQVLIGTFGDVAAAADRLMRLRTN